MTSQEPKYRKVLAGAGLVMALVLMVVGSMRVYSVLPDPDLASRMPPSAPPGFDPLNPELPIYLPPSTPAKTINPLTDLEIIEHATFTGLRLQDGRFYLTYDSSQKKGKRSCPT
jgi:hypothetical protein